MSGMHLFFRFQQFLSLKEETAALLPARLPQGWAPDTTRAALDEMSAGTSCKGLSHICPSFEAWHLHVEALP